MTKAAPTSAQAAPNAKAVPAQTPARAPAAKKRASATSAAPARKPAAKQPKPPQRAESKQAQLIAMLKRPDGATIAEVVETLAWQPHTVRGAIAGALKKKFIMPEDCCEVQ